MHVLLFGGSGRLGQNFIKKGFEYGYKITAVCRTPEKLEQFTDEKLTVIKGDARNLNDIDEHFNGKDAIVSCLGEYQLPLYTTTLYSTFTSQAIEKANMHHINKIIVCSAHGSDLNDRSSASYFAKFIVYPMISSVLADMKIMEDMLKSSNLDYTSVRPTHLVEYPYTGKYTVAESPPTIDPHAHYADIADFFCRCLKTTEYDKKMVSISTNK